MSSTAWLALIGAVLAITAVAAVFARLVSRDPAVRSLIGSFRGLRPRQQWRLAMRLVRDTRVPRRARLVPLAVLLYLMMPFDVIPDFLPAIGQLDDLLVVVLGAWLIVRWVPGPVIEAHRRAVLDADARTDVREDGEEADDDERSPPPEP